MKMRILHLFNLGASIFLIFVTLTGMRYFFAYQTASLANESLTQTLLLNQYNDLETAQDQIAALLSANKAVADELKAESERRLVAEAANRATRSELEAAIEKSKAPNTSAVISQWRPRIALVKCEWLLDSGQKGTKSGTAVLMPSPSTAIEVLTSSHMLRYQGKVPQQCTLKFPDQEELVKFTPDQITYSETEDDWARVTLTTVPAYALTLASTAATRCTADAAIGDSIVILGYPGIGSKEDITATEGIISGEDKNYYITSAKVERGNSGGAAILLKQNCYLGIPTFVDAGQIESLARNLDQRFID